MPTVPGRSGVRRHPLPLLVLLVMLLLVLTACTAEPDPRQPSSSDDAETLLEASRQALTDAGSFRVTGTLTAAQGASELDLVTQADGRGRGTVTLDGDPVDIVVDADAVYLRGRGLAAQLPAGALDDELLDRWVRVPRDSVPTGGDVSAQDVAERALRPAGELTRGETREIDGVPAVAVEGSDATVWVATEGAPYPLLVTGRDGSSGAGGEFRFSDFGLDVQVDVPEDAVSLQELLGAGLADRLPS